MRLMTWRALSMRPFCKAAAAASTLAAVKATADSMVAERDSTIAELESTVTEHVGRVAELEAGDSSTSQPNLILSRFCH